MELIDKKIEITKLNAQYLNEYSKFLVLSYQANTNACNLETCFDIAKMLIKMKNILFQIDIVNRQPITPKPNFKCGGMVNKISCEHLEPIINTKCTIDKKINFIDKLKNI